MTTDPFRMFRHAKNIYGLQFVHFWGLWFLREALFPSGSEEKLMFFFFFCCCFVTRIIDFCERHREGVTRLMDLGGLSLGF